jgi:glutamate--cysteine ligase
MAPRHLRTGVARLFPRSGERHTRVAVEHELVVSWVDGGGSVPIDVVRAAVRGAYADHLSFEPGGQVELSLPCAAGAGAISARLRRDVDALRADLARVGVRVDAVPVDPRPEAIVPLQLTSPRYVAMQAHFDRIGPAGRRMMRRTASTQVCLDWWPGRAAVEQWRVLNLAAPYLAAAFARSAGADGRLTTWLAVDPDRTAFDGRLLVGDDPVAAYADFAAGATVFTAPGDVDQHLTTLFPPVRPRGSYLEVRFPDVQDEADVERLVAAVAALVYDDDRRRSWLRQLEPERSLLGDLWRAAAAGDATVAARGVELAGAAWLQEAA